MQPIPPQFGYKDVVGDHGESLAKAKESDIHCPPHPCRVSHLFHQKGRQAGQRHTALGELMLAIPSHPPVLHDVDTESLRTHLVIFPGTRLSLTSWSFPRFLFFYWRQEFFSSYQGPLLVAMTFQTWQSLALQQHLPSPLAPSGAPPLVPWTCVYAAYLCGLQQGWRVSLSRSLWNWADTSPIKLRQRKALNEASPSPLSGAS